MSSWFEPLGWDVSRLVLGTAALPDEPFELLDAWLSLGGNAIDTARRYDEAEHVLGRWFRERGCRDRVVLATKGCHYDLETGLGRVSPEAIRADLAASLAALGVGHVDLYWLHRDDPEVPVGLLLDALNLEREAGRVSVFGASNWRVERLEEAERYAERHGIATFACSSPELGLAAPAVEPWPGCVSIHDPAALAWYEGSQLPVFAWSSQSAGYFAGVYNAHIARVYATAGNEERRTRAAALARQRGCSPGQIALAWVLHQPFPVRAVIGPRTVAELRESVEAIEIVLSGDEVRWLDLVRPGV